MRQSAVGYCGMVRNTPSADVFLSTPRSQSFRKTSHCPMHCDDGGSHMRKSFVALLLIGAAAFLTNAAFAQDQSDPGNKLMNAQRAQERLSRASRLGTSAAQPGDTVYVGHTPGTYNAATNPWALQANAGDPNPTPGYRPSVTTKSL